MDGVSSNHISHPLTHKPLLDIVNIPCSHLLRSAPHMLMCYEPSPNPELCHALDSKMCHALDLDLDICYAPIPPDPEMRHALDPKI